MWFEEGDLLALPSMKEWGLSLVRVVRSLSETFDPREGLVEVKLDVEDPGGYRATLCAEDAAAARMLWRSRVGKR